MSQSFSLNGATITTKEPTIRDAIFRARVFLTLNERYPGESGTCMVFANAVSQSTMTGDIDGWTLPAPTATDDELAASFEAWLELPAAVYNGWPVAQSGVPSEDDAEKKAKSG
jgi:hypothetical protein